MYKILDEQAISYAGIQAEKEKVKEAKKAERRGRPKKAAKAEEKTTDAMSVDELLAQPTEIKLDAPVEAKQQDTNIKQENKKKKARLEKTDKQPVAAKEKEESAPVVAEVVTKPKEIVEKNKPLLPPVVMETADGENPEAVVKEEPQDNQNPTENPVTTEPETTSTEPESKRLVFRHGGAKSVLYQVFPFPECKCKILLDLYF